MAIQRPHLGVIMLAFVIFSDYIALWQIHGFFMTTLVKLLTIHPLKEGQKEKRVQSGRWRKI
jgi:hypothetical protein